MTLRSAAALSRLLAWDAPFLPGVSGASDGGWRGDPEWVTTGAALSEVVRWPLGQRLAVALQLLAAGVFLYERGWHPSRKLLRSVRVERGASGPRVRLAELPNWRSADPRLERHLSRSGDGQEGGPGLGLLPVLTELLPEKGAQLGRARREAPAWQMAQALLRVILREARGVAALSHPCGDGRALWAVKYAVPQSGVYRVEGNAPVTRLLAAAWVLARHEGRRLEVAGGSLEEPAVASAQARAAARGNDCLVLTTLPLAGAELLPLAGGEDAIWVLADTPRLAVEHAGRALARGRSRPLLAAVQLAAGARTGFRRSADGERVVLNGVELASNRGRQALLWLQVAPVGLDDEELAAVLGEGWEEAVGELERLRLAERRRGRWLAVEASSSGDPGRLETMASVLPGRSWGRLLAAAAQGREFEELVARCEEEQAGGDQAMVLEVARLHPEVPDIAVAGAEAALSRGYLADAETLLEGVAAAQRDPRWHALAAWWAEQAGLPGRAAEELHGADVDQLPPRLAARVTMVAAEIARRDGRLGEEEELLVRAVARDAGAVPEAALLLAMARGGAALRELRRSNGAAWMPDTRARALQLLGLAALERGAVAAAITGLRAALRAASGENPLLLGNIHGDIGCAAILAERATVADRHLILAERLLERCGSRKAVTVVRFNRAVLANDRLRWKEAEALALASRELRGGVVDSSYWLEELELARTEMARGDLDAARRRLADARPALERHDGHPVVRQAAAAAAAHLALGDGDVDGAVAVAGSADDGERALIVAVAEAMKGVPPAAWLPQRWGVATTACLLAAWRRGEGDRGREEVERALTRTPGEAAVGLARFVAVLSRRGEALGESWADLMGRAELVLEESHLDGWAEGLRRTALLSPVRLLRALDGIINGGTDGLGDQRLAELGAALGLQWLEVRLRDDVVARWGVGEKESLAVRVAGVEVRGGGTDHVVAHTALELLARNLSLRPQPHKPRPSRVESTILGSSSEIERIRSEIGRWAPLPVTVLILGEPGTGKELVARELHRQSGRSGDLVVVNCAGIPNSLLEGEVFGWVKGAFTGADRDRPGLVEAAEGGTLFLDEVGELPLELQAKLLRLLQDREVRRVGSAHSRSVDVRFVAATNRDLEAAAAAGSYRQDLLFRLAVAVIAVPPLRERVEDIDELADYLTATLAAQYARPGVTLSPAAREMLRRAPWPGNVRELESVLIRAVAMAHPGEVLGPSRFPGVAATPAVQPRACWSEALESFRRTYFDELLKECGGNRTRAAQRAGISRQALLYHLRKEDPAPQAR